MDTDEEFQADIGDCLSSLIMAADQTQEAATEDTILSAIKMLERTAEAIESLQKGDINQGVGDALEVVFVNGDDSGSDLPKEIGIRHKCGSFWTYSKG